MNRTRLCVVLLATSATFTCRAAITNGDFESGLSGWSTQGTVATIPIPAPISSRFAQIAGSGRLWQAFTLPAGAAQLTFDFFTLSSSNPGDSGPPLNDTFAAYLVDDAAFTSIIPPAPGAEGIPAFLAWPEYNGFSIINTDHVLVVPPDIQAGIVGRVTVNLLSLPQPLPQLLRLELSVANGNDGRRLDAFIDNVSITIPALPVAMPFFCALSGAMHARPRRRSIA